MGTKNKKFHLTKEKKRKLKVLILQKVQQDLLVEAERKEAEKRSVIDHLIDPLDIEGASEEELLNTLVELYSRVWEAEKKRLDKEYQIIRKDFELNELTVQINEMSGKFLKPQLKRVNKTKNKIKLKRNEEAAKAAAFRSGLKATSGPEQKFELAEEEKRPDFKDVLEKKRKDKKESQGGGVNTASASEAEGGVDVGVVEEDSAEASAAFEEDEAVADETTEVAEEEEDD